MRKLWSSDPVSSPTSSSAPRCFRTAAFFEILLTLIYVVRVAWTGEWIGIAGGLLRVAFMGLLAVAVIRRGSRVARWAFAGVEPPFGSDIGRSGAAEISPEPR